MLGFRSYVKLEQLRGVLACLVAYFSRRQPTEIRSWKHLGLVLADSPLMLRRSVWLQPLTRKIHLDVPAALCFAVT